MCSIHGGSAHGHQRGSSPRARPQMTDKEDAPVLRRGHHSALKGATLTRPAPHPAARATPEASRVPEQPYTRAPFAPASAGGVATGRGVGGSGSF